jgi:hypothetical protein
MLAPDADNSKMLLTSGNAPVKALQTYGTDLYTTWKNG